jgi:hypothetical protein
MGKTIKTDEIKTHREIWGRPPKLGYEWDAGVFPQQVGRLGGRITVRLTESAWEIINVTFLTRQPKLVHVLESFPLGDDGERAAKERAREIYTEMRAA